MGAGEAVHQQVEQPLGLCTLRSGPGHQRDAREAHEDVRRRYVRPDHPLADPGDAELLDRAGQLLARLRAGPLVVLQERLERVGRRDAAGLSSRRTRTMPFPATAAHYDLGVPGNQAKLDAATELAALADEAGLTLIQLALAFVTTHPAVSAAIIGPRTADHLRGQLSAADVVLEPAVLDRIDRLVAPGTDLNPDDAGYGAAVLADPKRRRRVPE